MKCINFCKISSKIKGPTKPCRCRCKVQFGQVELYMFMVQTTSVSLSKLDDMWSDLRENIFLNPDSNEYIGQKYW